VSPFDLVWGTQPRVSRVGDGRTVVRDRYNFGTITLQSGFRKLSGDAFRDI
jgi:hypothetical protein